MEQGFLICCILKAAETLSKLENIRVPSLRELVDSLIFTNLLPKLPHQLKFVEILRVYVLIPLTPTFYRSECLPKFDSLFVLVIVY